MNDNQTSKINFVLQRYNSNKVFLGVLFGIEVGVLTSLMFHYSGASLSIEVFVGFIMVSLSTTAPMIVYIRELLNTEFFTKCLSGNYVEDLSKIVNKVSLNIEYFIVLSLSLFLIAIGLFMIDLLTVTVGCIIIGLSIVFIFATIYYRFRI